VRSASTCRDTPRPKKTHPNLPRDPLDASCHGHSQRSCEISSRRFRGVNLPRHIKPRTSGERERVRESGGVGNTVAVLVEEAEGLLELGDLVVGELVRHGNPSEDLTEGGRQQGRIQL